MALEIDHELVLLIREATQKALEEWLEEMAEEEV